jgi:hypothetical protein
MLRYKIVVLLILTMVLISFSVGASAIEVAGVNVPETASIGASKDMVVLNGAGIRKKFIIKVYVAALYLTEKTTDISKALSMPGAKRVMMHFVYKKVEAKKLNAAWDEGFRENMNAGAYNSMKPRLEKFKTFFTDMHRGDEVLLDYLPDTGTEMRINGKLAGNIEGEDFYRALLNVWLGKVPADKGLKNGMLGG